jgi:hypothetical protein
MRYVGAFYFPSAAPPANANSSVFVSWVALDVYIFWVLDGKEEMEREPCTQSRVTSATPAGRLIMSRLGRLLRDITGTPSLHFSLKLAINYIFILLLGAIKGIFVNRKILVFQITCDVFSPAARGQRTAEERYRLGKINTTKLAALERSTCRGK